MPVAGKKIPLFAFALFLVSVPIFISLTNILQAYRDPRFSNISRQLSPFINSGHSVFVLTSSRRLNRLTTIQKTKADDLFRSYQSKDASQLIDLTKIYLPQLIVYQPTSSSDIYLGFLKTYYYPYRFADQCVLYRLRD